MKKTLAKSLRSNKDKETNMPPFQTKAWFKRSQEIADRVKRKQGAAHERAIARKAKNKS